AAEVVERIDAVFPLEPVRRGAAPASRFRYRDGRGEVGVIASVTQPFCGSCDRVRLTADGQFRNCLFAVAETDLRARLRGGARDEEVASAIAADVAGKWAGHSIGQVTFIRPSRSMSQIGGSPARPLFFGRRETTCSPRPPLQPRPIVALPTPTPPAPPARWTSRSRRAPARRPRPAVWR